MIANLLILAFLVLMAYWWGAVQGLFSAFLHLAVTIIAGAVALALWEPLVLGFLIHRMPAYAWGVGLLGPFVLLMIGLRTALDKLVPGNVQFTSLVNWIAGGLCGLLAGILTAGLTLIGLGFLPLPVSLLGYQPMAIGASGQVIGQPGEGLWVAADARAAGFFTALSAGAFSTGTPMSLCQPELAEQSALFRMRYQVTHSLAIDPNSVSVTAWHTQSLPIIELSPTVAQKLGPQAAEVDNKLVIVGTHWKIAPATYDPGTLLNVAPTHVRLVVKRGPSRRGALVAPLAVSKHNPRTAGRQIIAFNDDKTVASSDFQEQDFAFIFATRADDQPVFILLRHLRLALPGPAIEDRASTLALLTDEVAPLASANDGLAEQDQGQPFAVPEGTVGPREGRRSGSLAEAIALDDRLPAVISKNYATGFRFDGDAVVDGRGNVRKPAEAPPKGLAVFRVYAPPHQRIVRITLKPDLAKSLFGSALAAAGMTANLWLEDAFGQKWFPTGFAWLNKPTGEQMIVFGDMPIQSGRELPITRMDASDDLYLYFPVKRGIRLVRMHIGQTTQDVALDVPE